MPVSTARTLPLLSTLTACVILATACPAEPGETTDTLGSTGVILTTGDETSTTATPTTEPGTTGEPDSTGGTTAAETSTTSDTTGPAAECEIAPACDASAADFCWAIADAAAAHQIGEPYAGILQGMCRSSPPCQTCWNLENYCQQLADDVETCDGLAATCACQAQAYGVL